MPREQVLVQLTSELRSALDQRAAAEGRSRSELIRRAVESYLRDLTDAEIGRRYVEAYTRIPQEPDPVVERLAIQSISQEPW